MIASTPVAPLGSHEFLVFLLQVGVLLALALLLGRLAWRFGMPAIVGELFAGVLLGPSLLDHVYPELSEWLLPKETSQFHLLDAFGQIGVLLLVGVTGIQLDLALVRRKGIAAVQISLAGLILPLAAGIACGFLLPATLMADGTERGLFAFFLGVAMCVSAIPVIAKTLMDMGLFHRNIAQLTLTAGMVDDAVGWMLLSIVSAMATVGVTAGQIATSLWHLAAVIAVAALVARPVVRQVLRRVQRSSNAPGFTLSAVVAMMLLSAAATHALALEAIFGAFVCGLVIASTGELEPARLAPLRTMVLSFLAPVFFATAGLRMDLTALGRPSVLMAALAVLAVAIIGKFTGAFVGALFSRLNRWEALALGAGMNCRGIVEVVVAMVGLRLGVLNTASYTIIILVAIVTSVMTPPIVRFAMRRVEMTTEEDARLKVFAA